MIVTVTALVEDAGTVVVFDAFDADRNEVQIGVEHRAAHVIAAALSRGEMPEVEVEVWQIL